MRIKRIVIMSCFVFLVGGIAGGMLSLVTNTLFTDKDQSVVSAVEGARDDWKINQFVKEQEKLHPDGLSESKVKAGSKYTGITYNGSNNNMSVPSGNTPKPQPQTTIKESKKTETGSIGRGRVKTNGGTLRVRRSGSSNAEVIGQVSKGDVVEILSSKGGWYEIKTSSGLRGYVSAQYVQKI